MAPFTITTTSSSTDVWVYWNAYYSSATSSEPDDMNNSVWSVWSTSSSSTSASDSVWSCWISDGHGNWHQYQGNVTENQQITPELARRMREEEEAREQERELARQKAEELLCENLDREQREQFEKTKWFYVISQSGKRYRIRKGWSGNIDEIGEGDMVVAQYCIHPTMHVPTEDSMLVQKLMLEIDESRFLEIANKTTLHTPRPVAV